MKVQELRQMLTGAERSLLEKAFVECYKQLSKSQKEEADLQIKLILSGEAAAAKGKKTAAADPEELEQQIKTFLSNARNGYYYEPNRVIPKSQRPKWRSLVKGYIKELEKVPADSPFYERAVQLLRELYSLLCTACNIYLFSSEDPFRSVGWEQNALYHLLAAKTFAVSLSRENIAAMAKLACTGGLSRDSLYENQEAELCSLLKTTDAKEIAIEESEKAIQLRREKLAGLKAYDNQRYYLEEEINNYCDLILILSLSLAETERGIRFFLKNSIESRKEIILYRALEIARWVGTDAQWLDIYRYGVSKKIKPREELVERYRKLMEKA